MGEPSEVEPGRSLFAHELEVRLLDELGVGEGETVLELASGFGALCVRLAERVRPGGRTICSDLRADRVAAMRQLFGDMGASDVDVRMLDMLRLELPDASADGILCRWGLMYAVPQEVALSEAFRVLRPGRRLAIAAWADAARNPWISLVDAAIKASGLSVPDDRAASGRMFSLGAPGRLDHLLTDAGFESVTVEAVQLSWEYASFEAYWDEEGLIPGPFEDFLLSLEPTRLAAVQDHLRASMEPYATGRGAYRIPGVTLVAIGRRPRAPRP